MKIKTFSINEAFILLSQGKSTKLSVADKLKVLNIIRAMKPVATKFQQDSEDAAKKMVTSDDLFDRYQKALQYTAMIKNPNCDVSKLPFGPAENAAFWKEWKEYNAAVDLAMKEPAEKEVDIEFEKLDEEAFGKLVENNDWTNGQMMALAEIILK